MQQDDVTIHNGGYPLEAFSEASVDTVLGYETMYNKYRRGWNVRVLPPGPHQHKVHRSFVDHRINGLHADAEWVDAWVIVTERVFEHTVMGAHVGWETFPLRKAGLPPQPIILVYFCENQDEWQEGEPKGYAIQIVGELGEDPYALLEKTLEAAQT